jgi:phosphate transport system substrate-binding protein
MKGAGAFRSGAGMAAFIAFLMAGAAAGAQEAPPPEALEAQVSALPEYRPEVQASGLLRSWGNPQMGRLMKLWQAGFHRYQPQVQFWDDLKGTSTASSGLSQCVADLALMGRQIFTFEDYSTYRRSLMLPVEIEVATGSVDVPFKSYALTVFVNRDNPLSRLTLQQLDGIFGAQRDGGWNDMRWNRAVARTAKENILTWGQLGLTGEWADKPVHPYGPPALYPGGFSFFQKRVLGGADTAAEDLREYTDPKEMMRALSRDRYGIAYTGLCYRTAETKAVSLAETGSGPFLLPTRETVASRAYPLSRTIYIYFAPDTPGGQPNPHVDPKIREFLRYILSRQGQEDVIREGDYLPLTAEEAARNRRHLDEKPKIDASPHY